MDWNNPKNDRARAAWDNFHALDGQFDDNVIIQIKNGPIDFQVREPASPLFEPHAAVTTAAAATAAHVLPWPPRGRRCGAADMWDSFRDFLWSAIVVFAFIAYLLILFHIIVDLFWALVGRLVISRGLSGRYRRRSRRA